MGLGFNDGFNAPKGFWEHYCEVEDALMGVEKDFPCNWCGKTEEIENEIWKWHNNSIEAMEEL